MRIGFFGDSYCAVCDHNGYETYIHKLKNAYSAEVVHLGIPGSSIYDNIMLQFNKVYQEKTVPDICVFTWTSPQRLFNRIDRSVTVKTDVKLYQDYFKYIYDDEQSELQAYTVLDYFDKHILASCKNTKFIHMFCFKHLFKFLNKSHVCTFENGVTLFPALYEISKTIPNQYIVMTKNIDEPNHLIGEYKNNFLFTNIKNAIDNYKSGSVMNSTFIPEKI